MFLTAFTSDIGSLPTNISVCLYKVIVSWLALSNYLLSHFHKISFINLLLFARGQAKDVNRCAWSQGKPSLKRVTRASWEQPCESKIYDKINKEFKLSGTFVGAYPFYSQGFEKTILSSLLDISVRLLKVDFAVWEPNSLKYEETHFSHQNPSSQMSNFDPQ